MISYQGQSIVILGAQRSGQAAARLAHCLGARVFVSEMAGADTMAPDFFQWARETGIEVECGGHTAGMIERGNLLVTSPGVRHDAEPIRWAKAKGLPVIGELEFAARCCPCPIIAVTGSNGKTTVSTLIHDVIAASGRNVILCGNVGSPLSGYILGLKATDFAVVEVSSFQLETIETFKPHVAVFLNFSQNHLDRHKDLAEYLEAKKRIFVNQDKNDIAVLNGDDQVVSSCAPGIRSRIIFFRRKDEPDPLLSGNPNFLAALKAAEALGISRALSRKVFEGFKGVEHRCEWVRNLDGVDYINDSKATTAEAARWALEGIQKPIIWICGGRDKNIDFSVLAALAQVKVKKILAIGEAKEKIARTFSPLVEVEFCPDLGQAVGVARHLAVPGDCVLFSPMCASFDMFKNYEERGKIFKEIVRRLACPREEISDHNR